MIWTVLVVVLVTYFFLDWLLRSMKVSDFGSKYVFITGCDTGFGRALAIRLDSLGFHVFAGCLTDNGAKELSEICSSRLITVSYDVTKPDSREAAVKLVEKKLPSETGLWAIVNNAGVAGVVLPAEMCSIQDYINVCNVNLFGLIETTRLFLTLVRKAQGRVVNMASIAGRLACIYAPYTVSKCGVEAFSDVLRREIRSQGVKVSILEPGGFKTNIINIDRYEERVKEVFDKLSLEVQKAYGHDFVEKYLGRHEGLLASYKTNLDPVVDAYTHAITSRFPRTRYVISTSAKLIFLPILYLPDWLADWVLEKFMHIAERQGRKKHKME